MNSSALVTAFGVRASQSANIALQLFTVRLDLLPSHLHITFTPSYFLNS